MVTTLAIALLFSVQTQGALEEKADFKYPLSSLAHLADDLSGRAQIPIRVTPEVAEFGVYVNVKNRSVREVLDLVAKATTTEWVASNGVITIRRTPVQRNAEAKRIFDYRLAEARKNMAAHRAKEISVDSMAKAVREADGIRLKLDQKYNAGLVSQLRDMDAYSPAQILGQELIDALGVEALLRMGPYERVVFSSHPTRLQRAMPNSMRDVVSRYSKLTAMYEEAVQQSQVAIDSRGGSGSELLGRGRIPNSGRGGSPTVARIHIVMAHLSDVRFGPNIQVQAFDELGNTISRSSFAPPTLPTSAIAGEAAPPTPPEDLGSRISLAAEAAERNRLVHKLDQISLTDPERLAVLKLLSEKRLVRNTENALSAALGWWAERNGDLVMESGAMLSQLVEAEFEPKPYLAMILAPNRLELLEENSVTIGRLRDQSYRAGFWNMESSLAVLANSILQKRKLGLDDLADLAVVTPDDQALAYMLILAPTLMGSTSPAPYLHEGTFALRAYGVLSKTDRRRVVEEGMAWEIGLMPPKLRALVEEQIARGRIIPGAIGPASDRDRDADRAAQASAERLTSWESESTVLMTLPKAMPSIFRLSFMKNPRVLQRMGPNQIYFQLPSQVGEEMALRELAASQGQTFGGSEPSTYSEVTKAELAATFQFGNLRPTLVSFPMIEETSYAFGPVTSLSKGMQEAISVAYKAALEKHKNTRFGRGGSGGPPPPPR